MLLRSLAFVSLLSLAATATAQERSEVAVPEGYQTHERADLEAPPRPAEPTPRPTPRAEGDPYRLVLMPTAFVLRKGDRLLNTYELATFEAELGVRDGLQIGVQTAIPVGLLGVGVSAKIGWQRDLVAVAIHAQALGAWFFSGGSRGAALGGLGVVMTIGNRDHFLSFGVSGWGGVVGRDLGRDVFGAIVPHLGGSLRLAQRARLVVEGWFPHRPGGRHLLDLVMVLYGFRIFGALMWADLGFLRVLCSDCNPPLEGFAPGAPYLSLGRPF